MEMTAEMANLVAGVVAMRPFVPASDLEMSREFYEALGFEAFPLGDDLASMHLGEFKFLLQRFSAPGLADNFMMHLLVRDVDA